MVMAPRRRDTIPTPPPTSIRVFLDRGFRKSQCIVEEELWDNLAEETILRLKSQTRERTRLNRVKWV